MGTGEGRKRGKWGKWGKDENWESGKLGNDAEVPGLKLTP